MELTMDKNIEKNINLFPIHNYAKNGLQLLKALVLLLLNGLLPDHKYSRYPSNLLLLQSYRQTPLDLYNRQAHLLRFAFRATFQSVLHLTDEIGRAHV